MTFLQPKSRKKYVLPTVCVSLVLSLALSLEENAFENLPRLQSIHLNSGSILCDCYLKWFPKWLNETTGFHRTHVTATCAHPELLKGHYITYVPYERYHSYIT